MEFEESRHLGVAGFRWIVTKPAGEADFAALTEQLVDLCHAVQCLPTFWRVFGSARNEERTGAIKDWTSWRSRPWLISVA